MQVQVDIAFEQLVQIAKSLPQKQWQKLKGEVEGNEQNKAEHNDLITFLLNGPTFNQEQMNVIEENRKAINKWRTI